jgi:hypothetical protein
MGLRRAAKVTGGLAHKAPEFKGWGFILKGLRVADGRKCPCYACHPCSLGHLAGTRAAVPKAPVERQLPCRLLQAVWPYVQTVALRVPTMDRRPQPTTRSGERAMPAIPHSARITGPVSYTTASGSKRTIPLGPCLLEKLDALRVDVVWGTKGQSSTALSVDEVKAAAQHGHLVLLD